MHDSIGRGPAARRFVARCFLASLPLVAVGVAVVAVVAPRSEPAWAAPCRDCPDPPPPPPPPPPPVPGDHDGDRIVDSYEDHLLAKFAPRIWVASHENRFPVNVDWLLSQSTLRFSHDFFCRDHGILPFAEVNRVNLTQQSHRKARVGFLGCGHYGNTVFSDGFEGSTKETFFLQFPDGVHTGIGPEAKHAWQLYGHVFQSAGRFIIQYWQLYSFNDSFGSANHEGDWEYSAVIVDANEQPVQVVFFRHGRDVAYHPSAVEWMGNHHITFSAKGAHGQYRGMTGSGECQGDGLWDKTQGFADNCNRGFAWDSWTAETAGIVNVGELNAPLNNSGWLRYSGLWGEIGAAADVIEFTSGPRGPAYKSSWFFN